MKRMHVALKVDDLHRSIDFYSALFGTPPSVRKEDYAKWLIDDPRVNFSIAERAGEAGIEHLGIQAEDEGELEQLYANVERADAAVRVEGRTTCCYAQSEKSWVRDPQGVEWEVFHTYGESASYYGTEEDVAENTVERAEESACCGVECCSDPAAA